jgi:hypothetical protein
VTTVTTQVITMLLAQALAGDAELADLKAIPMETIDALSPAYRLAFEKIMEDAQEHDGAVDMDRILSKANGQAEPLRETFIELLDKAQEAGSEIKLSVPPTYTRASCSPTASAVGSSTARPWGVGSGTTGNDGFETSAA